MTQWTLLRRCREVLERLEWTGGDACCEYCQEW